MVTGRKKKLITYTIQNIITFPIIAAGKNYDRSVTTAACPFLRYAGANSYKYWTHFGIGMFRFKCLYTFFFLYILKDIIFLFSSSCVCSPYWNMYLTTKYGTDPKEQKYVSCNTILISPKFVLSSFVGVGQTHCGKESKSLLSLHSFPRPHLTYYGFLPSSPPPPAAAHHECPSHYTAAPHLTQCCR